MDFLMTTRRYIRQPEAFTNELAGNLSFVKYNGAGTVNVRTGSQGANDWAREVLKLKSSKEVLIYVHGFNTTHDFARTRLTQIRKNTVSHGFPGTVIGLDWPSKGPMRPETYRRKRKVALDTGHRFFVNGLTMLKKLEPKIKIHLMAHSMGAFLLTYAIQRYAYRLGSDVIDQILFIAPDVERSVFERHSLLSAAIDQYASRLTCYFSPDDRVLMTAPGATHFPGQRSGLEGMRHINFASFEDVACHEQHRRHAAALPRPPKWDYSHRWHFNDGIFIKDTVDVLKGKPKGSVGARKPYKDGDQHLA